LTRPARGLISAAAAPGGAKRQRRKTGWGMATLGRRAVREPVAGRWKQIGRRAILAAGLILASLAAMPGRADPMPQPIPLTPQDQADLQRLTAYLNGITTMYARFQQYSSNGGIATGQMWMERPGRMRFEYNPPSPILLIADRFYVYYIDKQLVEMQKVGLESTPAWLLLRDPVTFDDLIVTGFARGSNLLRVTVVEKAHPDGGSLTMAFSDQPLALRQWTIVDAQQRTTTVTLAGEQFGIALDPKLFIYQDPFAAGRRYNDNDN
jgi:outer membrane lipoprotein-sorting protein